MARRNYYFLLLSPSHELIKTTSSRITERLVKTRSYTQIGMVYRSKHSNLVIVTDSKGNPLRNGRDVLKK